MACTSFLVLVWALLAVHIFVPLVSGRSVANEFPGEAELVDKRQWSGGVNGNFGKGGFGGGSVFGGYQGKNGGFSGNANFDGKGRFTGGGLQGSYQGKNGGFTGNANFDGKGRFSGAGLQGSYSNGNSNLSGGLNVNRNGQWGGSISGGKTWDNGRQSLSGSVGYQQGQGGTVGLNYKANFRRAIN